MWILPMLDIVIEPEVSLLQRSWPGILALVVVTVAVAFWVIRRILLGRERSRKLDEKRWRDGGQP